MKQARAAERRVIRSILTWAGAALCMTAGCLVDNGIGQTAAQTEILAAFEYKRKECGHDPGYVLPVPAAATAYGVELCSISIVRQKCPFREYPLFCLEMYNVDIPGIGP